MTGREGIRCWELHRRRLTAVCEALETPDGPELVVTIRGVVISNEMMRAVAEAVATGGPMSALLARLQARLARLQELDAALMAAVAAERQAVTRVDHVTRSGAGAP
jgi:hypothetical protein